MGYWLKSYTDILDDPKYHRMSERSQLAMHEIFLVAKMIETDELTGLVPCIEDISFYSRKSIEYWNEVIPELLKSGIIEKNGDGYLIVNYIKRQQAISDDERSRQYRKRKNDQRMSDDEDYKDNTDSLQDRHDEKTFRDGERESTDRVQIEYREKHKNNSSDPAYEDCTPDGEPIQEKKKKKPKDERSMSPAIVSFRRLTGLYPPKVNYEQIISVLGDNPDEAKMKRCYQDWCARGFKPTNINWLLDWYVNGVPIRGKPSGTLIGADAVKAELARLDQEANNG